MQQKIFNTVNIERANVESAHTLIDLHPRKTLVRIINYVDFSH